MRVRNFAAPSGAASASAAAKGGHAGGGERAARVQPDSKVVVGVSGRICGVATRGLTLPGKCWRTL